MYLIPAGIGAMAAPIGRGKARGAEFVRGAHRKTELRNKLKPTQPANSSVRPWKGGVPIYKVQFGGGANYLLATHTRTAPVHADRKATHGVSGQMYWISGVGTGQKKKKIWTPTHPRFISIHAIDYHRSLRYRHQI